MPNLVKGPGGGFTFGGGPGAVMPPQNIDPSFNATFGGSASPAQQGGTLPGGFTFPSGPFSPTGLTNPASAPPQNLGPPIQQNANGTNVYDPGFSGAQMVGQFQTTNPNGDNYTTPQFADMMNQLGFGNQQANGAPVPAPNPTGGGTTGGLGGGLQGLINSIGQSSGWNPSAGGTFGGGAGSGFYQGFDASPLSLPGSGPSQAPAPSGMQNMLSQLSGSSPTPMNPFSATTSQNTPPASSATGTGAATGGTPTPPAATSSPATGNSVGGTQIGGMRDIGGKMMATPGASAGQQQISGTGVTTTSPYKVGGVSMSASPAGGTAPSGNPGGGGVPHQLFQPGQPQYATNRQGQELNAGGGLFSQSGWQDAMNAQIQPFSNASANGVYTSGPGAGFSTMAPQSQYATAAAARAAPQMSIPGPAYQPPPWAAINGMKGPVQTPPGGYSVARGTAVV